MSRATACSNGPLVWRIIIGISLIPAFGTLYQRLTLPESSRFLASQKPVELDDIEKLKKEQAAAEGSSPKPGSELEKDVSSSSDEAPEEVLAKKAHIRGLLLSEHLNIPNRPFRIHNILLRMETWEAPRWDLPLLVPS